mmetsp:Transcript_54262/g.166971  ORF Transcript_54262/g.166971 Transcript_54262/m.166971 type:complete len:240 (+) Transcript_54262:838-1557(+)
MKFHRQASGADSIVIAHERNPSAMPTMPMATTAAYSCGERCFLSAGIRKSMSGLGATPTTATPMPTSTYPAPIIPTPVDTPMIRTPTANTATKADIWNPRVRLWSASTPASSEPGILDASTTEYAIVTSVSDALNVSCCDVIAHAPMPPSRPYPTAATAATMAMTSETQQRYCCAVGALRATFSARRPKLSLPLLTRLALVTVGSGGALVGEGARVPARWFGDASIMGLFGEGLAEWLM